MTGDREITTLVAIFGNGISGEMIRDPMLDCVERRFDAIRAGGTHPPSMLPPR